MPDLLANSYDLMNPHVHTGLLILRIVVGATIIIHGYNKFFGSGGINATAKWFDEVGMQPGRVHARVAAVSEITLGYLLAFGLITSFTAAGIVGLMIVACWVAHKGRGFLIVKGGWEYTAVLATIAVMFGMIGPGAYSIDYAIGIHDLLDGWYGLIISAAGGVLAASLMLAVFYNKPAEEDDGKTSESSEISADGDVAGVALNADDVDTDAHPAAENEKDD